MKLLTTRGLIRTVAERWEEQYCDTAPLPDKMDILHRLRAIDKDKAATEDVKAIIGNDSWTRIECDECKRSVPVAVQLGDEPDYESHTVIVCVGCLNKAIRDAAAHPHKYL